MTGWHFLQGMWAVLTLLMVLTLILSFIADYKQIRDASGWGTFSGIVFVCWVIYSFAMFLIIITQADFTPR